MMLECGGGKLARIAIMAAGAVGGYFGGRLAAAGNEVYFVARGAHHDALKQNGLTIESPLGDLHLADINLHKDASSIGTVDYVLFAVKLWDTETSGAACKPLMGPDTTLVCVQNGISSIPRLAPFMGAEQVIGGSAYIASVVSAPGIIRHTSQFARLVFGEANGEESARLKSFHDACLNAGIDATLSNRAGAEQWEKFVFLIGLSGVTALMRQPVGKILADPDCRQFMRTLMEEVVTVGRAKGVPLDSDFVADRMQFADTVPTGMKASMLDDLERGNKLELEWLAGAIVSLGKELDVATPANDAVYAGLKLYAGGTN
jgi:2-dehydropantoate 2-reductase